MDIIYRKFLSANTDSHGDGNISCHIGAKLLCIITRNKKKSKTFFIYMRVTWNNI